MDSQEAEFLKRLRATFQVEAEEHVRAISTGLLDLEKTAEPARRAELTETVFRETHSLKGAARSVDLREVEALCQPLEGALAALKRREVDLSPALFDLFHQAVDQVARLIAAPEAKRTAAERTRHKELVRRLGRVAQALAPEEGARGPFPEAGAAEPEATRPAPPGPPPEPPGRGETVRLPVARLAPLLLQAEEMLSAKLAVGQRVAELRALKDELAAWRTDLARSRQRAPDEPASGRTEARLEEIQGRVEGLTRALEEDRRALGRMVEAHLEAMKQALMLPVAAVADVLPKLVRDLSREQGKEVELDLRGTEIEVDKRVLEGLKDPLIHLIRNCLDHGLEKPEERARRNKPRAGRITLAFRAVNGRQVETLVADDGGGIRLEEVRAAAVNRGLLTPEAAAKLTPQESLALIFHSGVTTSPIITDVSGRGLGLAIVREKVEELGGAVAVETQAGAGTTFRLLLPLTLATFRGVLVRAAERLFLLPTSNVERAIRVSREEIKTVENRETISLAGQVLGLVRLRDVLELPGRDDDHAAGHLPVLLLASADRRLAFAVDEVLDEQQVLLKGLGGQLRRVRHVAGATVLGDGRVVPVLNVPDLMKTAARLGRPAAAAGAAEERPAGTGRILVAEDSITARTLLKNILETAGYEVATAVDGQDAFTQLRGGEFDLVVSDVDMPRLNGFELTARLRADKKLAELPVVLVTALESREDRERGIEVGADAYIVKSSFDQSNLLDVVRKLR